MDIRLSAGFVATFDDADAYRILAHKWWLSPARKTTGTNYCYTQICGRNVQMHRFVLGVTDPKIIVDHIDFDGLNNRRANLRLATRSQSNAHRRLRAAKSGFRGVQPHGSGYRAVVYLKKKAFHSTVFKCPLRAARAYNDIATAIHGDFAVLNSLDGRGL